MTDKPVMLDFVKALADLDRLKIVGLLADHPAALKQVADELSLPVREVYNHLEFLKFVKAVREVDGTYTLDENAVQALSRHQLEMREKSPTPVWDTDPVRQKALALCLHPDGTIRTIPSSRTQAERFRILLDYLAASFKIHIIYTEKEVNAILHRFHADVAGLRRDLIEASLLGRERDGSRYWRIEKGEVSK